MCISHAGMKIKCNSKAFLMFFFINHSLISLLTLTSGNQNVDIEDGNFNFRENLRELFVDLVRIKQSDEMCQMCVCVSFSFKSHTRMCSILFIRYVTAFLMLLSFFLKSFVLSILFMFRYRISNHF